MSAGDQQQSAGERKWATVFLLFDFGNGSHCWAESLQHVSISYLFGKGGEKCCLLSWQPEGTAGIFYSWNGMPRIEIHGEPVVQKNSEICLSSCYYNVPSANMQNVTVKLPKTLAVYSANVGYSVAGYSVKALCWACGWIFHFLACLLKHCQWRKHR